MQTAFVSCVSLVVGLVSVAAGPAGTPVTHTISCPEDFARVQALIANEDATAPALEIVIAAGTYILTDTFRIGRSHVSLAGEPGTRLVLADGVNKPVIAVGTQKEIATAADVISHIAIAGLEIDGNMDQQRSETCLVQPWIRNNGIDVRAVHHLSVRHVTANRNRSGGLVISWGCRDVQVLDCVFNENFFDGVAYYDSARVLTARCVMKDNRAAGISLDNDFVESVFAECLIEGNASVGIFTRWSRQLEFRDCVIQNSGDWAVFLAHDDHGHGVFDITISDCRVLDNRGGVLVASVDDTQSRDTRVTRSTFGGNEREGRGNVQTCGSSIRSESLVILTEADRPEMIAQSTGAL